VGEDPGLSSGRQACLGGLMLCVCLTVGACLSKQAPFFILVIITSLEASMSFQVKVVR